MAPINNMVCVSTLTPHAFAQLHTPRSVGHTAGYPVSAPPVLAVVPCPLPLSRDRFPTAPSLQQAADYKLLRRSLSALQQSQRRLSGVIAAYFLRNLFAWLAHIPQSWLRGFPQAPSPSERQTSLRVPSYRRAGLGGIRGASS